jgi:parvulin-like peptidyl-prolyl isomerase
MARACRLVLVWQDAPLAAVTFITERTERGMLVSRRRFIGRSVGPVVSACAVLVVAGCGGGGSSSSTAVHSESAAVTSVGHEADPNAVVARVGGSVITKASFEHALLIAAKSGEHNAVIPVPPNFTACVARLKASPEGSASPGASAPSAATLRSRCSARYAALETLALGKLILDDWVIGGAAEEGVSVSDQQVHQRLQSLERNAADQSLLEKNLAAQGRTMADHVFETRIQMLAEGIRQAIARKTAQISHAQVVSYYNQHKQAFGVPEQRDLHIVGAASEAEAERAKREIASGKSFATVVKKLPSGAQPIFSVEGLVLGYESGQYHQVPLNRAIFAARPHVLSGPVGVTRGYYVFEITRVHPVQQKSLAQSETAIKQALPTELFNSALPAFVSTWRARWISRTDCNEGYVVAKCRQFTPSAGSPPESPYVPALE